jgi:hypothetical protein
MFFEMSGGDHDCSDLASSEFIRIRRGCGRVVAESNCCYREKTDESAWSQEGGYH